MDAKFAHVWMALDKLRDEVGSDCANKATIEITTREDNPGEGKMIECLIIKCTVTKPPSNYDSYKTNTTMEYTFEVFADNENRPPRMNCVATRDLEKRPER